MRLSELTVFKECNRFRNAAECVKMRIRGSRKMGMCDKVN